MSTFEYFPAVCRSIPSDFAMAYGVSPFSHSLRNFLANFNPEPRTADFDAPGLRSSHASLRSFANLLCLHFRQGREQGQQNIAHQFIVRGKVRLGVGVEGHAVKSSVVAGAHCLGHSLSAEDFRVGNSSRVFSEVRDYLEMKIRTLLTRRKRRRKTCIGWWRWSNAYVYGVLGLYWDWKIHPLPSATAYA
jgi:hypothetical protein